MEYVLIILIAVNIIISLAIIYKKSGIEKYNNILNTVAANQERMEKTVRDEIAQNRNELNNSLYSFRNGLDSNLQLFREEQIKNFQAYNESLKSDISNIGQMQKNQLDTFTTQNKIQLETFSNQLKNLTELNISELGKMRDTVEQKLTAIQQENSLKLEQMRQTVDEKLHDTLEKRLGDSFNTVCKRLEELYKQLGEVQNLANGVDDLRKALMNVKTRGTWGEIQLGSLIEEILTPEQYDKNVVTKRNSSERVEYAIKLPGRDEKEGCVWLPIDAKFPQEAYQQLLSAQDCGDKKIIEEAGKQLEITVKNEAKDIREKYLDPPCTTDFGIMFLPTESLYAEVAKRPGLLEMLQREFRVVVASPTTLAALLNSLQMGFRTMAVEKRSSEIWSLLGAIKTEFGRFGQLLEAAQQKIENAGKSIEKAASKSRTIERKLKKVQELPKEEAMGILEEGFEEESVETEVI